MHSERCVCETYTVGLCTNWFDIHSFTSETLYFFWARNHAMYRGPWYLWFSPSVCGGGELGMDPCRYEAPAAWSTMWKWKQSLMQITFERRMHMGFRWMQQNGGVFLHPYPQVSLQLTSRKGIFYMQKVLGLMCDTCKHVSPTVGRKDLCQTQRAPDFKVDNTRLEL